MITPRRLLAVLLLGVVGPPAVAFHAMQTSGPATLELRADSPPDAVSLNDVLAVTLTVEAGPGLAVDVPTTGLPPAGWLLIEREPSTRETVAPGRNRWRQTYLVTPAAVGTATWQFPAVRYHETATPEDREIAWPPLAVRVTAPPPTDATPRDITAIEELPPPTVASGSPWLWLAVFAAALGGLVGLLVYRRAHSAPPARRAPAEVALRRCDRLVARRLPEQGRQERFVTLLTLILRRYLAQQYQLAGRRRTTTELLQELAADDRLSEARRAFLYTFLPRCDEVKFARAEVSIAECMALADGVRRFISGQ